MNKETLLKIHKILYEYSIYDWIVVILVLLIGLKIDFSTFSDDFEPYFNTDINQPKRTTTIPYNYLCIITFGVGAFLVFVVWSSRKFDKSISSVLAAYYFTISFTIFVTCIIKKLVGRPRPDTVAVCGGQGSYHDCIKIVSKSRITDQFFSFPSGHAAEAMAPSMFMTLLFVEIWKSSSMISMSIKFLPIIFALIVSISRIIDRAHHVDDVVIGLFIGGLIGFITFLTFIQKYHTNEKHEMTDSSSIVSMSATGVGTYNKFI